MRTTLTLDNDVAAVLERLRKSRNASLKELVNEALRRGLKEISARAENTVSTVSSVRHNDGPCQPAAGAAGDERHRAAATAAADADGADGADAKSAVHFG